MPSKTKKQEKAMRAAAHDPKTRRKMGISKATAEEFMRADQKKKGRSKPEGKKVGRNRK